MIYVLSASVYFAFGFILVCICERFDKEAEDGFTSAVVLWPVYLSLKLITSQLFGWITPWEWLDWIRCKIRGFE